MISMASWAGRKWKSDSRINILEKIEKTVVDGYQKIEDGVVDGYKKIENSVVEGFTNVTDKCVEKCLQKTVKQ